MSLLYNYYCCCYYYYHCYVECGVVVGVSLLREILTLDCILSLVLCGFCQLSLPTLRGR